MVKKMVRWMVLVVGSVMVIMPTAKATTIDIAASDLTTMNTLDVNMNIQEGKGVTRQEGFSPGRSIQEGFSRGVTTEEGFSRRVNPAEGFSQGVNFVMREERGCRRKNGQVR